MKFAYPRQRELHLIKKNANIEGTEKMTNPTSDIIAMKREFKQRSRLAVLNCNSDETINEDLNEQSSPELTISQRSR